MIKNRRALFILLVALVASAQEPSGESTKAASSLHDEAARTAFDAVAVDEMSPLELAARIDVLRAGIRLDDLDIARWCARRLHFKWLDHRETRRVVELLLPTCFGDPNESETPDLYFMLGCVDLPSLFAAMRPGVEWATPFSKIHVYVHASDVELGTGNLASSDENIRGYAGEVLWAVTGYSDDHRELVAHSVLKALGREPRETPPSRGIPHDLATLLEAIFLPDRDPMPDLPGGLGSTLPSWSLRWLQDVSIMPSDARLLVELTRATIARTRRSGEKLEERDVGAVEVFLRSLGHLDDEESATILQESFAEGSLFAAAALVERMRPDAIGYLVDASHHDAVAMALLLEAAPEVAISVLRRRVADERTTLSELLEPLGEDLVVECEDRRIRFATEIFAPITKDLETENLRGGLSAAAIGLALPGCATRTLAIRAIETIEAASVSYDEVFQRSVLGLLRKDSTLDRVRLRETLIAFLDVADRERFREALRVFGRSLQTAASDPACEILFELGDTSSDEELIAWMQRLDTYKAAGLDAPEIALESYWMREVPPVVASYILGHTVHTEGEEAPANELVALGVAAGLPRTLADWLADKLSDDERTDLARRAAVLLRAGSGIDALAIAFDEVPIEETVAGDWRKLATLEDTRVIAFLHRVQARRDLGLYARATGVLSLMGDAGARAEIHAMIEDGVYGFCTTMENDVASDGFDPKRMPYWIEDAKSQCCRIWLNGSSLQAITDRLSWSDDARDAGMTSHERAKRRWDAYGGKFVYHALPRRFVPAP